MRITVDYGFMRVHVNVDDSGLSMWGLNVVWYFYQYDVCISYHFTSDSILLRYLFICTSCNESKKINWTVRTSTF